MQLLMMYLGNGYRRVPTPSVSLTKTLPTPTVSYHHLLANYYWVPEGVPSPLAVMRQEIITKPLISRARERETHTTAVNTSRSSPSQTSAHFLRLLHQTKKTQLPPPIFAHVMCIASHAHNALMPVKSTKLYTSALDNEYLRE